MIRRFLAAVTIGVAVLACSELVARWLLPTVPSCVESVRNPYRFRGWPEFMAGHAVVPGTGRVVLLTNSQGYAGELPEYKTYPYRLEELLNEHPVGGFKRWEVLNWATDGMTAIELSLLAAYLQDVVPEMVVAVTGYADYAVEHDGQGFLYCRTDVPRLGVRWAILRRTPGAYRYRHLKVEDTLSLILRDRLALLRFREYAWSWLESRLPGVHEMFYAPQIYYLPWDIKARPWTKPLRKSRNRPGDSELSYTERSVNMLDDYLTLLARLPTHVLVVSQPVGIIPGDSRWEAHTAFQYDLRAGVERHGLAFWDMHDGLPKKSFITSSHFHPVNHRRFAELLAERLTRELGDHEAAPDTPLDTDTNGPDDAV